MVILIDYDNVPEGERRKGIAFLVENSVARLADLNALLPRRIDTRIYGGWFDGNLLSSRAQNVAAEIGADFPRSVYSRNSSGGKIISCELAVSLLADRTAILTHTFRRRGIPNGLRCYEAHNFPCSPQTCGLNLIRNIVAGGSCPSIGCSVLLDNFMYRAEQKLVDTMLSLDLVYVAERQKQDVVLISSDDDFVPSLRVALQAGVRVYHLHSQRNFSTPPHYARTLSSNYKTKNMW